MWDQLPDGLPGNFPSRDVFQQSDNNIVEDENRYFINVGVDNTDLFPQAPPSDSSTTGGNPPDGDDEVQESSDEVSVIAREPTTPEEAKIIVGHWCGIISSSITLHPKHAPLLRLLLCLHLQNNKRGKSTTAPAFTTLKNRLANWDGKNGVHFYKDPRDPRGESVFTVVKGGPNGVYEYDGKEWTLIPEKKRLAIFVLMQYDHKPFGNKRYFIVSFCAVETTQNSNVTNTKYYLCAPCFCEDPSKFFTRSRIFGTVSFLTGNGTPSIEGSERSITVCDKVTIPDSHSPTPESMDEEYESAILSIFEEKEKQPALTKSDEDKKRSHHKPKQPRNDKGGSSALTKRDGGQHHPNKKPKQPRIEDVGSSGPLPRGVFGHPDSMCYALPPVPPQTNAGQPSISDSGLLPMPEYPQLPTISQHPSDSFPQIQEDYDASPSANQTVFGDDDDEYEQDGSSSEGFFNTWSS